LQLARNAFPSTHLSDDLRSYYFAVLDRPQST
jgi:hypothetical protein